MLCSTYPFELPPLPYDYDALEPYIDAETMHYHHDKHFQTYINNLNEALDKCPKLQCLTLEQILSNPGQIPPSVCESVLHNGGGVYNHARFFEGLAPADSGKTMPGSLLMSKIRCTFGSLDNFKEKFSRCALDVFGSGYTYLVSDSKGMLKIVNLQNQQTLLAQCLEPIILLDVWEHAYYLKYKNARKDYVTGIWNVIAFPQA